MYPLNYSTQQQQQWWLRPEILRERCLRSSIIILTFSILSCVLGQSKCQPFIRVLALIPLHNSSLAFILVFILKPINQFVLTLVCVQRLCVDVAYVRPSSFSHLSTSFYCLAQQLFSFYLPSRLHSLLGSYFRLQYNINIIINIQVDQLKLLLYWHGMCVESLSVSYFHQSLSF